VTASRRWAVVAAALLLALAGMVALLLVRGGGSSASGRVAATSSAAPSSASTSSATSSSATSSSARPPATPEVVFIGDSWTVGSGATGSHGFAPLAAERLGWDYHLLGIGGSGYLMPGGGGPYMGRVGEAVALHPDLIVVAGSLNDSRADLGRLHEATANTLMRLREEAAETTAILVVGAPNSPWTTPSVIERINQDIAAAADAAGVTFVDPVKENWTDPADPAIWADELHPNDVGHQRVADALAPLMQEALDRDRDR
jgi:lysophospholipase L1-like esterase